MKTLVILSTMIALTINSWRQPVEVYQYNYENILGTSFELKITGRSEDAADRAELVALSEIMRLDAILSSYKSQSEFSRWQRTWHEAVPVSAELFEVLSLFDDWRTRTDGALNASAAIAGALWQQAAAADKLPSASELQNATAKMSQPQWVLDARSHTATRLTRDPLVLNSFVKSYILNRVSAAVMALPEVDGAVVNIGGDIVVAGGIEELISISNPRADAENDKPLSYVSLSKKAVATSGNYRRGYQVGDEWFSHIIDPRTALPVRNVISATVVADDPATAGALATALNVMDPATGSALAASMDAEFIVVMADGATLSSEGWSGVETSAPETLVPIIKGEYELTIEFELARPEGNARRPFVAIWIEDSQKEPVRNIALWYNKPRWLPDLKRWYTKNYPKMSRTSVVSISSATRSPGRYTLKWDGLDDTGKSVPQGTYTVYIEAAREHGTYQLIRQEIEWNGKPRHIDAKGGLEIPAASFDVHKTSSQK